MSELLAGKKGVILGVANEKSIATGIAQVLRAQGAELAFNFLPDERGRMEQRVRRATDGLDPALIAPCDINDDGQIDAFFGHVAEMWPQVDFLVHSIAYAPLDEIRCPTLKASREGFRIALEASAYSFLATARRGAAMMRPGGAMLTLTYYGGEKVVTGYNLMGVAKAALEACVRYAAHDLGREGVRVNAISAGPIKTLAASAIGDFGKVLSASADAAPMGRNVTAQEVGKTAAYLLSDLSSGTTGEVVHVDGGSHIMGGSKPPVGS